MLTYTNPLLCSLMYLIKSDPVGWLSLVSQLFFEFIIIYVELLRDESAKSLKFKSTKKWLTMSKLTCEVRKTLSRPSATIA